MADSPPRIAATLIVHRYFWPENISVLPLMFREVAQLHLARGETVDVVTASSADFAQVRREEFGPPVRFDDARAPPDRGKGGIARIGTNLGLLLRALRALGRRRYRVLYTVSYPPLLATIVIGFARLFRRAEHPIYYVQDIFSYRIGNQSVRGFYRWLSGQTIRAASATITLSEAMKQELLSCLPPALRAREADRIFVIPNFAVDGLAELHAPSPAAFDIIYAGNHGIAQNLEQFLRALAHPLVDPKPRVEFFGGGNDKARLQRLARDLQLQQVVQFRDPVDRTRIAAEMARARFGLVGATGDLMRYAFPSKLAGYAAAGTPSLVMCDEGGETARWLETTGLGLPLDPDDPELAARQLQRALQGQADGPNRERVLQAVSEQFGRRQYLERMQDMLDIVDPSAESGAGS